MTPDELKQHEERLLEKKAEIENLVHTREFSRAPSQGDDGDRSMVASDDEIVIQLQQNDAKLLRAIENALTRIRDGVFGICSECEEPIPQARLNAVPWTRVCVACKERQYGN